MGQTHTTKESIKTHNLHPNPDSSHRGWMGRNPDTTLYQQKPVPYLTSLQDNQKFANTQFSPFYFSRGVISKNPALVIFRVP